MSRAFLREHFFASITLKKLHRSLIARTRHSRTHGKDARAKGESNWVNFFALHQDYQDLIVQLATIVYSADNLFHEYSRYANN